MDVDIYMTSYQEQMLRLALHRHFETERANFCNRTFKIKTLALFFIDDISSYRPDAEGKQPYLLQAFERLLREEIERMLDRLDSHEGDYRDYLQASLADIPACHGGYFSQDNSDSDEDVAQEVDVILHGKKQLLSFRKPDGTYHTLRFLFSKWTLKEGWDNPNIFTIAKLRSSGSENSKLQEVGRGLRLPVDENGNRIANEEFQLNYIVDFTEADFAERLVNQINGEIPESSVITEERLQQVAHKMHMSADDLFDDLYDKRFIDRKMHIRAENRTDFFAAYPDFAAGLSIGKVRDRNTEKPKPVRIRKAVYSEIRQLWETINQRYLLVYDRDLDRCMEEAALEAFEKPGVFTDVVMTSDRKTVTSDGRHMGVNREIGVQYIITKPLAYHEFLKRITSVTGIPILTLHKALVIYTQKHGIVRPDRLNESSVAAFCSEFQAWKQSHLQGRFRYVKGHTTSKVTALTYEDGTPRDEIAQGRIGTKIAPGDPSAKYLYDALAYDSPLERANITADIDEVVVYGKIPRSSIAIPTTTGGMYSPDFMYIVKKKSGEKELNIIVETKDVENKSDLRETEKAKIDCARVFFELLSKDGYIVHFRDQLNNKQMAQIIRDVLQS